VAGEEDRILLKKDRRRSASVFLLFFIIIGLSTQNKIWIGKIEIKKYNR
jgi:predicted nucleic acid-binding Zn ribbon protein